MAPCSRYLFIPEFTCGMAIPVMMTTIATTRRSSTSENPRGLPKRLLFFRVCLFRLPCIISKNPSQGPFLKSFENPHWIEQLVSQDPACLQVYTYLCVRG